MAEIRAGRGGGGARWWEEDTVAEGARTVGLAGDHLGSDVGGGAADGGHGGAGLVGCESRERVQKTYGQVSG